MPLECRFAQSFASAIDRVFVGLGASECGDETVKFLNMRYGGGPVGVFDVMYGCGRLWLGKCCWHVGMESLNAAEQLSVYVVREGYFLVAWCRIGAHCWSVHWGCVSVVYLEVPGGYKHLVVAD